MCLQVAQKHWLIKKKKGGEKRKPQNECSVCHPFAELLCFLCVVGACFAKIYIFMCVSFAFHAFGDLGAQKFKTLVSHVNPFGQNRAATWMDKKKTPQQNNKQNTLFSQAVSRSPHSMQARQCSEKAKRKIRVFILIGGTKLIKVISQVGLKSSATIFFLF